MYKFIFVLLVVVGMATASNAQEKQNMKQSDNKPLVAYFSVTGTTARAAEKLARVTGGELYAITPNRIQMPISTGMTKGRVVR